MKDYQVFTLHNIARRVFCEILANGLIQHVGIRLPPKSHPLALQSILTLVNNSLARSSTDPYLAALDMAWMSELIQKATEILVKYR
jgi:hypothetical protein